MISFNSSAVNFFILIYSNLLNDGETFPPYARSTRLQDDRGKGLGGDALGQIRGDNAVIAPITVQLFTGP